MSYLYRCKARYKSGPYKGKRCQQRHALPRKVEDYTRKPKCPSCGNFISFMDTWQMNKNKETTCNCGLPIYPHRAGSHVLCKQYTGPASDEELEAAFRSLTY